MTECTLNALAFLCFFLLLCCTDYDSVQLFAVQQKNCEKYECTLNLAEAHQSYDKKLFYVYEYACFPSLKNKHCIVKKQHLKK